MKVDFSKIINGQSDATSNPQLLEAEEWKIALFLQLTRELRYVRKHYVHDEKLLQEEVVHLLEKAQIANDVIYKMFRRIIDGTGSLAKLLDRAKCNFTAKN